MFIFRSSRFACPVCKAFTEGAVVSSDFKWRQRVIECTSCARIYLVKFTDAGWPDPSRIHQIIRRESPARR